MRLSWSEWNIACNSVGKQKNTLPKGTRLPKSEQEVAAIWRALDEDCSGYITLKEFDSESYTELSTFKRWCTEHHGSAMKTFHWIDGVTNGNGKISQGELALIGPRGYPGDCDHLFETLNVNNMKGLSEEDFRFIDHWDLDWEEWEADARIRNAAREQLLSQVAQAAATKVSEVVATNVAAHSVAARFSTKLAIRRASMMCHDLPAPPSNGRPRASLASIVAATKFVKSPKLATAKEDGAESLL